MKIGLRREDKTKWEARIPLVPDHIKDLVAHHGLKFTVQPSDQRAFSEEEFKAVGAEVSEDLGDCPIIMGVKEIPAAAFERGKTYVFFSHTIKGQSYNMPMLRRMMELECNLIDYERIADERGMRLVAFGVYAGLAGMIDTMWSLGQRLKVEGRETPLGELKPAHQYSSLQAAKEHLESVAGQCRARGALKGLGPIVCGVTGYGRVGQGAQEVYRVTDPIELSPDEVLRLDADKGDGQFHLVVFKEEHMVKPVDASQSFELQDYFANPSKYEGCFEQYLPHLTVLANCIYWENKYPRLVSNAAIKSLYGGGQQPRLRVIGDISCDVEGSVECTVKPTDPGNPVYVYEADSGRAVDGFEGTGPVIMAVEILPTELPRESSAAFSSALLRLMPGLANSNPGGSLEEWGLPDPLKRAVILHKGKLTSEYEYIARHL